MPNLPKKYEPSKHEQTIYKKWEEAGAFSPKGNRKQPPFVITLPPPNITGSLHMGHALNGTIQDVLIRYHRMKGDPTLWQPGTDHAGIATQNVIEKKLREEGKTRHDIGRDEFIERVWDWRKETGDIIISQMKHMGFSCDWDRTTFTMDEAYVNAVQETFITYYKKGYIYRGNRLVNWCPRCASVISDLEIARVEKKGTLFTLKYPVKDNDQFINVATTRPETMLGDTAVAVHPNDKRYKKLVGQKVILPITNREVPIVADERIDLKFGTGAVKITPAHDPLDAEIGTTHKLPAINVIGKDGKMTNDAGKYEGLTTQETRQKVLAQLTEEGFIEAEEKHTHTVTTCDRCSTDIEPLISRQWFVDMSKLKDATIKVVEDGLIEFHPPRWKKHFLEWMNNIHDWTISRQLWWGHQIPVWWKPGTHSTENEEGNFKVSVDKPTGGEWEQDPDVLDTWFSSALWPFATLGWPQNTSELKQFFPTSVLSTARDILYLWVARMIFSSLELLEGEKYGNRSQEQLIPFKDVLIHPTVLNIKGQRMSKSLGTGVDPLNLIKKYGADATRFSLMYQMSFDNQAIKFDESATKSARNFANKIWNIARFLQSLPNQEEPTIADEWIQNRFHEISQEVTGLLDDFKLGEATQLIYEFIWSDFADWYVEILKIKGSTKVANQVFTDTLKLLHPFMPHLTELLWSNSNQNMLITSPWEFSKTKKTKNSDSSMNKFQNIVNTVRSARTLLNIPPAETIDLYIKKPHVLPAALEALCRANLKESTNKKSTGLHLSGDMIIYSSSITSDSIKKAKEKLLTEQEKLSAFIDQTEAILKNMAGKAPEDAIKQKKATIKNTKNNLKELKKSLQILDS
jgi:valyl-tRNA synthetase